MIAYKTDTRRTVYKLTNSEGKTYGGMQWGEGITHEAPGRGDLCTDGWIHCYDDPGLAVLMDPIHGAFTLSRPRAQLWRCEAWGKTRTDGVKRGVQYITTLERLPMPEVTREQWITFAIRCAQTDCTSIRWNKWAEAWLSGEDRSAHSAIAMYNCTVSNVAGHAAKAAWQMATWIDYKNYQDHREVLELVALTAADMRSHARLIEIVHQVLQDTCGTEPERTGPR